MAVHPCGAEVEDELTRIRKRPDRRTRPEVYNRRSYRYEGRVLRARAGDAVARAFEETLRTLLIRDLPLPEPLLIPLGTPVHEVIEQMRSRRRPCVLVCDGRKIAGIFTERDVLNRLTPGPVNDAAPIDS